MSKTLNTPFQSKHDPPPTAHERSGGVYNHNNVPVVDKPATPGPDGVDFLFYADGPGLTGSPAALASPMGTAIPNIGHGFKGGK